MQLNYDNNNIINNTDNIDNQLFKRKRIDKGRITRRTSCKYYLPLKSHCDRCKRRGGKCMTPNLNKYQTLPEIFRIPDEGDAKNEKETIRCMQLEANISIL